MRLVNLTRPASIIGMVIVLFLLIRQFLGGPSTTRGYVNVLALSITLLGFVFNLLSVPKGVAIATAVWHGFASAALVYLLVLSTAFAFAEAGTKRGLVELLAIVVPLFVALVASAFFNVWRAKYM